MTLDEAIRHAEEVAEIKEKQIKNGDWEKDSLTERNCIKSAEEHRQLAEWLRDYKRLKEQEPCEDAISRKDLISHIENQSREWGEDYDAQQILGDIEDMPSVKPQERTGHWEIMGEEYIQVYDIEGIPSCGDERRCSECGFQTVFIGEHTSQYKYCPKCGARMESEQNE